MSKFQKTLKTQSGFATILIIPIVLLLFTVSYFVLTKPKQSSPTSNPKNTTTNNKNNSKMDDVGWTFDGQDWSVNESPPACPDPLLFPSPVDANLASGILYPGQLRGADYKPHGGFRFDNLGTNKVEVRAIMDGHIFKAAKYDDGYEIQVSIFFVNDCGIMVMHDHLLKLSPKLEEILKDVPLGHDGDSRTTNIPRVNIKKGELLGTEIGYPNFPGGANDKNVFVDFGLYDLRKTNGVNYDTNFRSKHPNINEYGTHALCWFDLLEEPASSIVKNLPAGGSEGKVSDYCN